MNLIATLEATKAYAKAFNEQDVVTIADMLDQENCIFVRQEQNSIIGKDNVLRRIRNLFWRAGEQHKHIQLINAIADLGSSKARPCLICLVNNIPVALCVISCKINRKITSISILLSGAIVSSARPTEPMPGLEQEHNAVPAQEKRADLVAITKVYVEKLNHRNLQALGELFDEHETVFHRSDQQAIIGKANIISRIQNLYQRTDKHGQHLHVINAIIDHQDHKAWPCAVGYLDGVAQAVAMLQLRSDGKIASINVSLEQDMIAKARPTEPVPEVPKKKVTLEQVLEREKWVHDRLRKIANATKKHGNLPHLVSKKIHLERQMEKLTYLKKKLA
jgi:hypothetical protein